MSSPVVKLLCVIHNPQLVEHIRAGFANIQGELFITGNVKEALEYCERWKHYLGLIVLAHDEDHLDVFELRRQTLEISKDPPCIILTPFITKQVALKSTEYKVSKFLKPTTSAAELAESFVQESSDRIESILDDWDIVEGFINDSQNLIDEMEDLILELEQAPEHSDTIDRVCAILHTIKGTSAFFRPDTISKFAHHFEDYLGPIKKGLRSISSHDISVLLAGLDVIKGLVDKLIHFEAIEEDLQELIEVFKESSADSSQNLSVTPVAPLSKKASVKSQTIKVEIDLLEEFMECSGRVTIARNMMDKVLQRVLEETQGNKNINLLLEIIEELHKVNGQMQNIIDDIRKVPLRSVFKPISRTLSDLRRKLDKDIHLEISGEDLRVDTVVADVLSNSLTHIIRNCVDHGIETADERLQSGKPETGCLKLKASLSREDVVVELSDDGRGIDLERVKAKVVENQIYTEHEVSEMNDKEIMDMIFHPGFSTAAAVTDVSGRGVGMDMVKKSVCEQGGRIELNSELGVGTDFRLIIPIPRSVTVVNGMMIELNQKLQKEIYFIPRHKLLKLVILDKKEDPKIFENFMQNGTLEFQGELVPVVHLSRMLEGSCQRQDVLSFKDFHSSRLDVMVVSTSRGNLGLYIDGVGSFEDLIVKNLPVTAGGNGVFSGVTFLDDTQLSLVLDVDFIAQELDFKPSSSEFSESLREDESLVKNENLALLFKSRQQSYAIAVNDIDRVDRFPAQKIIRYGINGLGTIIDDHMVELLPFNQIYEGQILGMDSELEGSDQDIILVRNDERLYGLLVDEISDLTVLESPVDAGIQDQRGLIGSLVVDEKVVSMVDPDLLVECYKKIC